MESATKEVIENLRRRIEAHEIIGAKEEIKNDYGKIKIIQMTYVLQERERWTPDCELGVRT